MAAIETGKDRPAWESVSSGTAQLKTLWSEWDRLDLHGGMLCRKWETENGNKLKLQGYFFVNE